MLSNYDLSGKTILIAEDEQTNFLFLKALLKKTNAYVIWAQTGKLAVEEVQKNPNIDIILMDVKMPDMNGYEATKAIKKIRPNLPIIAQTAFALTDEKEKLMEAGYNEYISKPIDSNMLFEKISAFI